MLQVIGTLDSHLFESAAKAKAPIVAIPLKDRVPFCVKRTLLAKALKGVTVLSAELVRLPDEEHFEEPKYDWKDCPASYHYMHRPEGPSNRTTTPGDVRIRITGRDGRVKTSCLFIPVKRQVALQAIRKWSDAERERHQKRILKGALDAKTRRELKRAQFEEENEAATVLTNYAHRDGNQVRRGIHVDIPEMPGLEFVLVRTAVRDDEVEWSVTERRTGRSAGRGTTAENAIVEARQRAKDRKSEVIASITADALFKPLPVEAEEDSFAHRGRSAEEFCAKCGGVCEYDSDGNRKSPEEAPVAA